MSKFVIDEIKTITAIHLECPVCGFANPKEDTFCICPICNTNLVVQTADISKGEPFCVSFAFGK